MPLRAEGARLLEEKLRTAILIGGALGYAVTALGVMLVFLPRSRVITGQLLAVDGGAMTVVG